MNKILVFFSCVCFSILCLFYLPYGAKKSKHPLYDEFKKCDFGKLDKEKILHINVGIDYIPYHLIELFEDVSGVKVVVDIFDCNNILESKLLCGKCGYDVVFPTVWPNYARGVESKVFRKIDKKAIDFSIFNSSLLKNLKLADPNLEYGIPFQWGLSGIGVNMDVFHKEFPNAEPDSWGILFDLKYVKKMSKYGIAFPDSASELYSSAAVYLGYDATTTNIAEIKRIAKHVIALRQYISKFTHYGFEDLASGNAAIAMGTSGDIKNVIKQRNMLGKKSNIRFVLPKEGSALWIDIAAIPCDAIHIKNAHAFLKFLTHPKISAIIVNETHRATAVYDAYPFVDEDIRTDKDIFPKKAFMEHVYIDYSGVKDVELLKAESFLRLKGKNDFR